MTTDVPRWLWRWANGLLAISIIGVAALTVALARGWADPPRAGALWLFDDFGGDTSRWAFAASEAASIQAQAGALRAEFTGAGEAMALTANPPSDNYTLEMTGAGQAGALAYGLTFAWQDETHYSAVLVNGNGYAEAYRQNGAEHAQWFAWQQWPHIRLDANRVRVEVRGPQITIRINEELVVEANGIDAGGRFGLLARSEGTSGEVTFGWAQVWADVP